MYFQAFISLAFADPCSNVIEGNLPSLCSTKSAFVPTNTIQEFGEWVAISGFHLVDTFSNVSGSTIEKHIKNTSVIG